MGRNWDIDSFTHQLSTKYLSYFDVFRNEKIGSIPLEFIAMYKRSDEKYMVSKRVKVWGVQNQQLIFATKKDDPITGEFIDDFGQEILSKMDKYIPADNEHMSTIFLGIIITNYSVSEKVEKKVRKYRKLKFIRYGLHGWAEVYIAVVNLSKETTLIHPKGKQFIETITNMLKEDE